MKPLCGGVKREFNCALCGRPPEEPCPREPKERPCSTCNGTGKEKA